MPTSINQIPSSNFVVDEHKNQFFALFMHTHANHQPQWSLDSAEWVPVALSANASVTVEDLLDGVHSISLKNDYTADGRSETESVDYT